MRLTLVVLPLLRNGSSLRRALEIEEQPPEHRRRGQIGGVELPVARPMMKKEKTEKLRAERLGTEKLMTEKWRRLCSRCQSSQPGRGLIIFGNSGFAVGCRGLCPRTPEVFQGMARRSMMGKEKRRPVAAGAGRPPGRHRRAVAVPVGVAVPRDHRRARRDLAQRRHHPVEFAGFAGTVVPARLSFTARQPRRNTT